MRFGKTLALPIEKLVLLGFVTAAFGMVFVGIIANAFGPVFLTYVGYIEVIAIALLTAVLLQGAVSSGEITGLASVESWINPKPSLGLIFSVLSLAIFAGLGFLDLPVFGWDVLDQWGPAAGDYLRGHEWTWENYRSAHPATISALIAIADKPTLVAAELFSSKALWTTAWVFILALIFLHAHIITGSLQISLVLTVGAMTIPLFENHLLIHGYAEIFLSLIIISTASLLIHIAQSKRSTLIAILFSGVALASLKNIGVFLWSIITSAYFLAWIYREKQFNLNLLVLAGPIFLFSALFLLDRAGLPLEISMRYRDAIPIQPENMLSVPRNELYSLFLNASFGVIPAAIFFGASAFFRGKHADQGFNICALIFIGLSLFILFSQLTQYGFFYAVPERDTGNTRFTLPVILTGMLVLPYAAVFAQEHSGSGKAENLSLGS